MTAAPGRSALLAKWWVVLIAALALTAIGVQRGWTARLDYAAYDLALAVRPSPAPGAPDPLIVAVDEASLSRIGAWPWPRSVQAALVDRIAAARPRSLGLDILLVDPRDPGGDAALSTALGRAAQQGIHVALPVAFRVPGINGKPFTIDTPLPTFTPPGVRTGHVNLSPDSDGVVRRFYERYAGDGREWAALPSVMLGRHVPSAASVPARRSTLSAAHPVLIDWRGPPGDFATIPAAAVLAGEVPDTLLQDRDILVGLTASGLGDTHATPPGRGTPMAGVEIQANALITLAQSAVVRPAPDLLRQVFALLPLLALFVALRTLPPGQTGVALIGLAIAVVATSLLLLRFASSWISPVPALVALALAWPAWAWVRLVVTGRFVARELDRAAQEGGAAPPAHTAALSQLDRQLALLEAVTLRERALRAEHDDVIRLLSHDMRSPQGAILSLTEPYRNAPLPPEITARIRDSARRTLGLADGFVHLSRAQLLDYTPTLHDLVELARDGADAVWAAARDRNMSVDVEGPSGPDGENAEVLVLGEPALLQRMIINLAENAIKYGTPGCPVQIKVSAAAGKAVLAVCNSGPDIPADRQADLFERFSRVDGRGLRGQGVGLGLAFVHTVATRHGGSVACYSAGGTTTFTVWLPLAQAEE